MLVMPHKQLFHFQEQKIDGILGGQFLVNFAIMFDFPRHLIAFMTDGKLTPDEIKGLKMDTAATLNLQRYVSEDEKDIPTYILNPQNLWQVNVTAKNGAKSVNDLLAVDTGAPTTSISRDRYDHLGLEPFDRAEGTTMGLGSDLGNRFTLTEFDVSTLSLKNWTMESLGSRDTEIPPLLGEDIMSYCDVLFDFPARKMYIKPVLAPVAEDSTLVDAASIDKARLQAACMSYSYGDENMSKPDSGAIDYSDPDGEVAVLKAKIKGTDLTADANQWDKIGDALYADQRRADAKSAYEQCVASARQAVTAEPTNPNATAILIIGLADSGQIDEAVKLGQSATSTFPTSSIVWRAYGVALHEQASFVLTGLQESPDISDGDYTEFEKVVNKLRDDPQGKSEISQAAKLAQQSRDAFDNGVKYAPSDSDAYKERWEFRIDDARGRDYVIDQAFKSEDGGNEFDYPDSYDDDLDKAADLKPTDVDLLSKAAQSDNDRMFGKHPDLAGKDKDERWNKIPVKDRQPLQDKIDLLTELSTSSKDVRVCAEALAALGDITFYSKDDRDGAIVFYKSALDKDPTDGNALISLTRMMSDDRNYSDLHDYLTGLVAKKDCALARFLLARTDNRLGLSQAAQDSLTAGLAIKPDSFWLNAAMAYQLLSATTPDNAAKAKPFLDKAEAAIGKRPHTTRRAELEVAWGVYQTETGDMAGARARMVNLLTWFPICTQARDIIVAGTIPALPTTVAQSN